MPLYIKDKRVAELARDLARRRRCTVTEVVRQALEKEARASEADRAARWQAIREIQARAREAWQGPRTSDHAFLYNEQGNSVP